MLLGLESGTRGRERYARVGSGSARQLQPRRLGCFTALCLLLPTVTAALSLGVPLVTLTRWLVAGGVSVWQLADFGPALGQTLMLALAGAMLTTVVAVPMAWLSIRAPGRLRRAL